MNPAAVSVSGKGVVYLAAGGNHCAAITEDGNLYTWGRGSYGRLGHGEVHLACTHVIIHVARVVRVVRRISVVLLY